MDKKFRLYVIKNLIKDTFFTGVTSSENNLIYWLYNQYRNNNKYAELGESIKEDGLKNHKYVVLQVFNNKDDADKKNYDFQQKLQEKGKLINKMIINPEREVCSGCGFRIRKLFMQKHLDNYCTKTIVDDLSESLL